MQRLRLQGGEFSFIVHLEDTYLNIAQNRKGKPKSICFKQKKLSLYMKENSVSTVS